MLTATNRSTGNTIEITVTIPWIKIQDNYNKIVDQLINEIELPGFRKGKAPRDLALKQLKKERIYEEVLKKIIPEIYGDVVQQEKIHPIISPKAESLEVKENESWKVRFTTCELPNISLGNYRLSVSKIKLDKKSKIWLPGQKPKVDEEKDPSLTEILDAIYQEIKVELSQLLLEQEVNRLLSNLLNELQKLGLTVEQYLQSQAKTSDQLRNEYTQQAQKTLSLEFALEKIADAEGITVEPKDIDDFIKAAKTDNERAALEKEKYYIGSLLRRQKTLKKLIESPGIIKTP
jgi:FKBP-type peptidyl-prolyl cis-trans isomerase (trigger factor)